MTSRVTVPVGLQMHPQCMAPFCASQSAFKDVSCIPYIRGILFLELVLLSAPPKFSWREL